MYIYINCNIEMEIAQLLEQIATNEEEALALYDLAPETSEKELTRAFKEKGVSNWQLNLKLIEEIYDFEIEETFRLYIDKLKDYTMLRRDTFALILKAIQEDSNDYDDKIMINDKQVARLVEEIGKMNI
jgi:hypothetical protein